MNRSDRERAGGRCGPKCFLEALVPWGYIGETPLCTRWVVRMDSARSGNDIAATPLGLGLRVFRVVEWVGLLA